ncbi:MAG: serine/threonine protein kinase, partial [Planctomycetota bacterium]
MEQFQSEAGAISELEDRTRFRLTRKIAEGGMGAVYEAKQLGTEGFEKTMAIKTILQEYTSDPEFVDMFIGEAKLVADLVHEYIVQV